MPSYWDRTPGNAAVFYGKVRAEETIFFANKKIREEYHGWLETPAAELRKQNARMMKLSSIEDSLRRAANCDYCDWQLPIRTEEPFYQLLLPELQESREHARLLAAKARTHIAHGEFDEALASLRMGYAGAHHVCQSDLFVGGLVGIAWCGIMNDQTTQFIQQPGAPNLYWALTMLPQPLFDLHDAADIEARGVERSFSEFGSPSTQNYTPDQWRQSYLQNSEQLQKWLGWNGSKELMGPEEVQQRCVQREKQIRDSLAKRGVPHATVEDMVLFEAATRESLLAYRELYQDALKYFFVPYPQAAPEIQKAMERASRDDAELYPIAAHLVAAVRSVKVAVTRSEREVAVLRIFEALRIHAARNSGKLPEKLGDVTAVPIPNDPVTGKPFGYELKEGKALLTGPVLLPRAPLRYEISVAK